ncbi:MAG: N-acetyl-gamma-glutamyl-phosphate reductase [Candidatus Kapaibacterium sp.]|nr:MAG: N-acetyl-gamma-glutamyl-phosphate reductase [Candidatus Kapabacteria bacterium]
MTNPQSIKAGIIGGAGYTGGELLRVLLHHPHVEVAFVHSSSNAGKPLHAVHSDVLGDTTLHFSGEPLEILLAQHQAHVLFLCVGHGEAIKFFAAHQIPSGVTVIDLSQDFRYADGENAAQWLYGLPELNRSALASVREEGKNIANPGCFATAIQLALLPLARAGKLPPEVHLTGVTGSTGAGQRLSATSHFSWRTGNISVYKAFSHQHLREVQASLQQSSSRHSHSQSPSTLHFVPMRGSFTRGILVSMYCRYDDSLEAAQTLYAEYYKEHPFVQCTFAGNGTESSIDAALEAPDVKQVVGTNKCVLHVEKHGEMLFVVSVIDNLLKGASGQAVQNMNLAFGFPEDAGLRLRGIGF